MDNGSYDPDGDPVTLALDNEYFGCSDVGHPTFVTLYVVDNEGSFASTCQASITVLDETPPVPVCKDVTVNLDEWGEAHISVTDVINDVASHDNCGIVSWQLDRNTFFCDNMPSAEVYVDAYDIAGHIGTCLARVYLRDDIPPVPLCRDITVSLDGGGNAYIIPDDIDAGSYDNCRGTTGISDKELSDYDYNCFDVGIANEVTLTVWDDQMNLAHCTAFVTVIDNEPPVAYCREAPLFLDENGEAELFPQEIDDWSHDNCPDVVLSIDGPTLFTCENLGPNTVTLLVTDDGGLEDRCTTTVHVYDQIAPRINCAPDITVTNDPGFCGATHPVIPEPTVIENCDYTLSNDAPEFFPVGMTPVTWTVDDHYNMTDQCTQQVTVVDAEPPVIICPPAITLATDPGFCHATVTMLDLGEATATDNCGIQEVVSDFSSSFPDGHVPFGIFGVNWTATDFQGNSSVCVQTIEVNKIITITEVTVSPTIQAYSDLVEFTATIQPGECQGSGKAATHVTFFVGTQPMGDPVLLVQAGDKLVGTAIYPLLDYPGFEGTMDPDPAVNPKVVKASFSGVNPNFEVINPATELTVMPENSCAIYAGVYFASTGSVNSDEATVVLAATIVDENDGFPGDITNALVQFYADGRLLAEVPVTPTTQVSGDEQVGEIGMGPTIGTASFEWTGVPVGTYDILVKIVGYYTNDPDGDCDGNALVTVDYPTPEFITGGGYVIFENSMGLLAGTDGLKNNFGFVVKYNRKMTNLQGNLNTIVRRMEGDVLHLYKIKSNAMTSLAVTGNTATFTGKATIQDITDPMNVLPVAGNCILQFTLTDKGEPGFDDMISITVWKGGGGLWFTTFWDDVALKPAEQTIDGGNLVVHSDDGGGGNQGGKKKVATIETIGTFNVYPNPFNDRVYFDLQWPADAATRLDILDITGATLKTVFEGKITGGQLMRLEYVPQGLVTKIILYRLTVGEKVFTGKLLYKK